MEHAVPNFPARARDAAILIVDDAPANLAMLRSLMAQQGYQAFVANSGERAIEIARRVRPDLILLDVVMPDMDGLETCRQLKLLPETRRIPVIFMSARTETEDVVAGFEHGGVDYVSKPLRMAEVWARVRTQLQIHGDSDTQQNQAERLRAIVDGMAEGLMIVEPGGTIQYANPACNATLGYPGNALAGHTLADLLHPADMQECLAYFERHAQAPQAQARQGAREITVRRRDGSARVMDLTLSPMQGGDMLFVGLLHDITRHKQQENALERAALADPLTRIANRRHFDAFMETEWQRAIRNAEPLSLIVLDVDHFKLYNDALGHAAGDVALCEVATILAAHALRPGDLAARYGGEEFVLLCADTAAPTALALAEVIRGGIEGLQMANPNSPTSDWVTASIGVATMIPTQIDDIASFFVAADRAMYAAKEAGRNRVLTVSASNSSWDAVKALVMG